MNTTLFIHTILSFTCLALSGNTSFSKESESNDLQYSGATLSGPGGVLCPDGNYGNTVKFWGGNGERINVYGARTDIPGNVSGNTVIISGGSLATVSGGTIYAAGRGSASDNTVEISGGTITWDVHGGYVSLVGTSPRSNAFGNKITISGGSIGGEVCGALVNSQGDATENTVTISGGSIARNVSGGSSLDRGISARNKVSISGGSIGMNVYGGGNEYSESHAIDNTVDISGGTIKGNVYGGSSLIGGISARNKVSISGGSIGMNVYGGGDEYSQSHAIDNTVDISGGTIKGNVYGGHTRLDGVTKGNTVTISGGSVEGNVCGGFASSGNATNNTVILRTGAILAETSSVYGGFSEGTGDVFTGNRLVLGGFRGTIGQIANFEFIDIRTSSKEQDMVVIAGGEPTNLNNVKLTITFSGQSSPMKIGDTFTLIRNDDGLITDTMALNQNGQQKVKGTAYIYGIEFGADQTTIHATVTGRKFNDRSKALAEGRVATMAHLNMGGDLIAEQGMDQALRSGREMAKVGKKINLFAAMSATSSRYDTGSHIDLYGYSALAGAAITPPALTSLNAGLFAESGWGHYGSMSDFDDGAVRGAGRSKYYGGGLMAQYDFTQMGASGLSVDASFRAGKADTSFTSGELPDSHYDLSAPYYGIHTGINYTRKLSAKLNMANYARFFWTHLDGDDAPIDGSDFSFRTMDSQRIKAGTRFLYEACTCLTPYAGASYEWECSGTARAVVDGENGMAAPSLRGGTGTGELGAIYQPMSDRPFWVDLSVHGHVGERRGISGGVRVRAEF